MGTPTKYSKVLPEESISLFGEGYEILEKASVARVPSVNIYKKSLDKAWTEAFQHLLL